MMGNAARGRIGADDEAVDLGRVRRENAELRAALHDERHARELRVEVERLAAETSGAVSRAAVAAVIAEGATRIFSAGWAMVAYRHDGDDVRIVHGSGVPADVQRDWQSVPLDAPVPMCDVLRGERRRVELRDRSEFTPWPAMVDEADRAAMESFVAVPVGVDGAVEAVVAISWNVPYAMDDRERELLELLIARMAPAMRRSQRTDGEAEVAAVLQRWLLESTTPRVDGIEIATMYAPGNDARAVGGDWHDVIALSPRRTALVIGDVCGHDVRAAVEMSRVRSVLAASLVALEDPVAALETTDAYLRRVGTPPMATALVVVVGPNGNVTLTSAGHPDPLVHDHRGTRVLVSGLGAPLGSGFGGYRSVWHRLAPGSVLVGYTDGVVESRAHSIDAGIESLRRRVERVLGSPADADGSRAVALSTLVEDLEATVDDPSRVDDAAALVARLISPTGPIGPHGP